MFEERHGRKAWVAATVGDECRWTYNLDQEELLELGAMLPMQPAQDEKFSPAELPLENCRSVMPKVLETLKNGCGFAVIDRIPVERMSHEKVRGTYISICTLVGHLLRQDIEGTAIYDIRDPGNGNGSGFIPGSLSSSFHTDNACGDICPDYVSVLCITPAQSGGHLQLISAYTVYQEILNRRPDVIEGLSQPFPFNYSNQVKKDEKVAPQTRIIEWAGNDLTFRYLYYQMTTDNLSRMQRRGLAVLEDVIRLPYLMAHVHLRAGQFILMNNHWILHNRTPYKEHCDPGKRRHYLRLWLSSFCSSAT